MIWHEMWLVAAVLGLLALWIFGAFAVSLLRNISRHKSELAALAILPQIREALVNHLAGSDNLAVLRGFVNANRNAAATAIMSFGGTVAGSARDRLCELSLDLSLVHDWCQDAHSKNVAERRAAFSRLSFVCSYEPCRQVAGDLLLQALDDPDDEIQLAASRALVQSGGGEEVERVFAHTIAQNLLVRILLTEDLRRHAEPLCRRAIPEALESRDVPRIRAALQMILAWERSLPMAGTDRLLESEDRQIRILALQLVPLVPDEVEVQKGIIRALADPDPEIASYGAKAAGRLRLESAIANLARCLRGEQPDVARLAAAALAGMPIRGWPALQELASNPNPMTAQLAGEALARARGVA